MIRMMIVTVVVLLLIIITIINIVICVICCVIDEDGTALDSVERYDIDARAALVLVLVSVLV